MEYIKEPIGQTLNWTQPHAGIRYHELKSNGRLYATLKWKTAFGSLAVGECNEGRFTFERAGSPRPYVTVQKENSETNFAILRFTSGSMIFNAAFGLSGTLEFDALNKYAFHRLSLWKSMYIFTDRNGEPIVVFKKNRRRKPTGVVKVGRNFGHMRYLSTLLILGWYVLMFDYEEAEAAIGTGRLAPPN
jgi:hypothetical protein